MRNFLTLVLVCNGTGGPTNYASNMKGEQNDVSLFAVQFVVRVYFELSLLFSWPVIIM